MTSLDPRNRPITVDGAARYQRTRTLSERLAAQEAFPDSGPPPRGTSLSEDEEAAVMALCGPNRQDD